MTPLFTAARYDVYVPLMASPLVAFGLFFGFGLVAVFVCFCVVFLFAFRVGG